MLTLREYAAIFRQFGVNFRVCFSERATFVMVKGIGRSAFSRSPLHDALATAGARIVSYAGAEGVGLYFQIESL